MGCYTSVDGNLMICRPTMKRRSFGFERKRRWCFTCRKHVRHEKVTYCEVLEYDAQGQLLNGYYEPISTRECPTCHQEDIYFPGCEPL